MDATSFQLHLVNWQFFGTATWRSSKLGTIKSREDELWDFLKWFVCFRTLNHFAKVPITVRWERGELGGRPHAHYLIGGLLPKFVNLTSCFQASHEWHQRCGLGRLRLVSTSQDGASGAIIRYLQKQESTCSGEGADAYELGKFGKSDRLIINDAAWRLMLHALSVPYKAQARTL